MLNSPIQPAPNALPGSETHLSSYKSTDFPPNSAVLCRNTAPLVRLAYFLLQNDVSCHILGKDIGQSLITLVRKMNATSLEEFLTKLELWRARESARAEREYRDPEKIDDQATCLRYFADSLDESSQTVASLIAKIELLFDDKNSAGKVTLSTIHKAKGLEWSTVFLLDWHLLPSKYATQKWQRIQERNLQWVAVTRTKDALIYINSGNEKIT